MFPISHLPGQIEINTNFTVCEFWGVKIKVKVIKYF